jgi:hypothetical protein
VIEAIAGEARGAWNKRIIGLMARSHSGKLPGDRAGRQPPNALVPAQALSEPPAAGNRTMPEHANGLPRRSEANLVEL